MQCNRCCGRASHRCPTCELRYCSVKCFQKDHPFIEAKRKLGTNNDEEIMLPAFENQTEKLRDLTNAINLDDFIMIGNAANYLDTRVSICV